VELLTPLPGRETLLLATGYSRLGHLPIRRASSIGRCNTHLIQISSLKVVFMALGGRVRLSAVQRTDDVEPLENGAVVATDSDVPPVKRAFRLERL
jgi:hypothetical protein